MDLQLWAVHESFQGMAWRLNQLLDDLWGTSTDDLFYSEKMWAARQLEGVVQDVQKVVDATNEPAPPHEPLEDFHRMMSGSTNYLNDLCQNLTGVDLCEGLGFDAYRERWQKVTRHKENIIDFAWQTLQEIM